MNTTQIIGAIMMATGKPVPEVAKEHGYSKHTFYRVINNETNSPKVQQIIAELVNKALMAALVKKQVSDIWPEQIEEGKKKCAPPEHTKAT